MNILLISISVLQLLVVGMYTGLTDGCYIELAKDGLAIHPMMVHHAKNESNRPKTWWGKLEDGECMFYKRIKKRYSLKLTLESSKLDGYEMKVYVNKRQRPHTWEEYAVLQEGDEYALRLTGYQGIKIITRNDTEFQVKYETSFCQIPNSVNGNLCTKKQQKGSSCAFNCNDPLYSSVEPFALPFLAKCKKNRQWSVDFSQKCVSIERVKDLCLTIAEEVGAEIEDAKPDGCNFTDAQLAYFFPESNATSHTPEEMLNILLDFAMEKYSGVFVGVSEDKSRGGSGVGMCFDVCLRNEAGKYHITCDEQKGWKNKKICYACRYRYKVCDGRNLVI